jgi:hypothetical protein
MTRRVKNKKTKRKVNNKKWRKKVKKKTQINWIEKQDDRESHKYQAKTKQGDLQPHRKLHV